MPQKRKTARSNADRMNKCRAKKAKADIDRTNKPVIASGVLGKRFMDVFQKSMKKLLSSKWEVNKLMPTIETQNIQTLYLSDINEKHRNMLFDQFRRVFFRICYLIIFLGCDCQNSSRLGHYRARQSSV